MTETLPQDLKRVIHFSECLNRVVYLDEIHTLTDDELVKLNVELTHIVASIKSYYVYLEKRFDLDYDLDDSKLIRTKKKYFYMKRFIIEVEREREKRFQASQGISFSSEEFRRAMSVLKDRRKNLYSYVMDMETQKAFLDLLKENYGDKEIDSLAVRAKVIANSKAMSSPILTPETTDTTLQTTT